MGLGSQSWSLSAVISMLIRAYCCTWLICMDWLMLISHLVWIRKRNSGFAQMSCVFAAQFEWRGVTDFRFSDFLDWYHSTAQLAFVITQQLPPGSGCRMSYPIISSPGFVYSRSHLEGGTLKLLCSAVSGRIGKLARWFRKEKLVFASFLTPCSVGDGCTGG